PPGTVVVNVREIFNLSGFTGGGEIAYEQPAPPEPEEEEPPAEEPPGEPPPREPPPAQRSAPGSHGRRGGG
ncbi:MAG: hypothetical protein JSU87_17610, partial [Gemmatimonadota bacterium]